MKGLCWLPWGWGGRESCSAQKNQPGVQSDPEGPVAIFRIRCWVLFTSWVKVVIELVLRAPGAGTVAVPQPLPAK